jgi:hypothetical protein
VSILLVINATADNTTTTIKTEIGSNNTQQHELFNAEIARILNESESVLSRILLLPETGAVNFQNETTTAERNTLRSRRRRELIPQSPLSVKGAAQHGQSASQSTENARIIEAHADFALKVSRNLLLNKHDLDTNFDFDSLSLIGNIRESNDLCPFHAVANCNGADRFSQLDGSCNNLQTPWFGKVETPYKRYMAPVYDDRLSAPRSRSTTGAPLPNPRVISRALSVDNGQFDETFTHLVPMFGQFLAHDVTSAAVSSGSCYFYFLIRISTIHIIKKIFFIKTREARLSTARATASSLTVCRW